MQALHDQHTAGVAGHATRAHRQVPPLEHRLPFGRTFGALHVVWIVADDAIRVFSRAVTLDRGGQPITTLVGFVVGLLILISGEPELPSAARLIPAATEQGATFYGVAGTESRIIGSKEPAYRGIVGPFPGGPEDAGEQALAGAWWDVDQEFWNLS